MAVLAMVAFGGLPPALATTVGDTAPTMTEAPDTVAGTADTDAGDAGSCLAAEDGSDPLAAPFCLMGVEPTQTGATEGSDTTDAASSAPAACKVPLQSDKCPTWVGTYDHGQPGVITAKAVGPTGDRVYLSALDTYIPYSGEGGGTGASVVAIDQDNGQQLWAVRYEDPRGDRAAPSALAVSPDGTQLYVTGMSFGTVESGWDFVTMAYGTADGRLLWSSRYEGAEAKSRDGAISVAVSGDGTTLYVTGSSGPGTVTEDRWAYNYDYATVAYAAESGQQLWAARYARPGNDQPMSVGVDPANSRVFVTGFSSDAGTITGLFSNQYVSDDTNSYDFSTVAYDAGSGAQVWERRYGGGTAREVPRSLRVAPDGSRVFVTGSTKPETGPSEFATVAYDASSGEQSWESLHSRPSFSSNEPSALAVSPDGERVYVTGTSKDWLDRWNSDLWFTCFALGCFKHHVRHDYVTVAYLASSGHQAWASVYDHLGRDIARDIAVSPDSQRIFVTGVSEKYVEERSTLRYTTDSATVAYAADGTRSWVGRYAPAAGTSGTGLGVAVGPDSQTVVVTGAVSGSGTVGGLTPSESGYSVFSYEAYGTGPSLPKKAPAPAAVRSDAGSAEGSFSLMSMAHSTESSAGPAVAWDGTSEGGAFRYNSSACSDTDPVAFSSVPPGTVSPSGVVNNISTNLTTYNTLIPGSASPGATRTQPFEFQASAPGADGKSRLSGNITVVACSLADKNGTYGDKEVDTRPDSELPRISFKFEGTAEKGGTQETTFEGTFEIMKGTGIYEDVTGKGRIHGYLFCFIEGYTAGGCAEGEPFRDVHYTMTGWYQDPTVPGAPKVFFPPVKPADVAPPASADPGVAEGPFSLMHMIHAGTWDGTSGADGNFQVPYQEYGNEELNDPDVKAPRGGVARPVGGSYAYSTMPCGGNAPVNNVSTNLTTYNSRLPGSAAPASVRNQPFKFQVSNGDHPRQRKINGSIALDVCHRKGGPTKDGMADVEREKINFEVSATAERVSGEEIRFDGTFKIVGGTGVYEDLTGYGQIHGYLFCFVPSLTGSKGGFCAATSYRDGQYTMNGWYSDPTVAELGIGPTKVAFTDGSPRSGQYSDQVTPKATLQDYEGKPIADAAVDFELKGAGGTRSWTATTDAQGVAAQALTLDLVPGAYDLSVRYAGSEKRGPSSDKVAFTIAKEATSTALSVENKAPKRTLRARVADDDTQRVAGVAVQFLAGGKPIGTATTDANGEATLVVPARYQAGPHQFGASFAGDERYLGSSGAATT